MALGDVLPIRRNVRETLLAVDALRAIGSPII